MPSDSKFLCQTSSLVTCACLTVVDDPDAGTGQKLVYMSHDTKNTRKSSLTGLQPIYIIHPYHPWCIYIYICCFFTKKSSILRFPRLHFSRATPLSLHRRPQSMDQWQAFRCLSASWCCCLCLKQCHTKTHAISCPKAIPAQKCQIKNWACWSTPEIKKRLPCRFAVLRFQQLRVCRAISLKCRRPKQHWFVLVAAGTLMQQNRWNKCQLPCIRRL